MALLTLTDVHQTYGEQHLLRGVSLVVGERERIGIVGQNGSGKSTLLRILAGTETPDAGDRTQRRELEVGFLEQEPDLPPECSVRDTVREGLAERTAVLAELDRVHGALAAPDVTPQRIETLLGEQARLDDRLERLGGHDVEHRIESLIDAVGLRDPDARCGELSGGERRRTALAQLLVRDPDVLLLDEPTNHLDAEVIAWLEGLLAQTRAALVLITHDRYFLDRVVERIVELERGVLHEYDGGYREYVVARAERLAREQKEEATRRNLLRRETDWIRRGPPARTTKSKSRIARYDALVAAAPEVAATELQFTIPCEHRLGERVLTIDGLGVAFDGRAVLRDVSLEIGRGERLGIVGPNGAGKTTFLRACMGLLEPDADSVTTNGNVAVGSTVRFSFIDQARTDLDPDATVVQCVGGSNDFVTVGGRAIRIESYLESFLFPTSMMRARVGDLSGGERNRILLAKLLAVGGNVLVLDEPTNDLDLTTLRVLEEALCAFAGAALIVSHDRWFLDRVATRTLHIGKDGTHRLHVGDVSDLLESLAERAADERKRERAPANRKAAPAKPSASKPHRQPKRLSSAQRRELDALPERIDAAETELAALDEKLADPSLYDSDRDAVRTLTEQRRTTETTLTELYARWEELEALDGGGG